MSAADPRELPVIAIVGAGAVGLFFGAQLRAGGARVTYVTRGESLSVIPRDGVRIVSQAIHEVHAQGFAVVRALEDLPPNTQLVLLATKTMDVSALLPQLRAWCMSHPLAMVVPLQNGVENESSLVSALGSDRVVSGLAFLGSERIAPGVVRHYASGSLSVGTWRGAVADQARYWAQYLADHGVRCTYHADMVTERWRKLFWNLAFNPTTALTGLDSQAVARSSAAQPLIASLLREALAVAQAEGASLTWSDAEKQVQRTQQMPGTRTSMQVDLQSGRRTEYDAILGAVVRAAARHGVYVPVTTTLYQLLATIDGAPDDRSSV